MDDEYKIIDFAEMEVPFNLNLNDEDVTHTVIQGPVGTGMSIYAYFLDTCIKKGPYYLRKNWIKKIIDIEVYQKTR